MQVDPQQEQAVNPQRDFGPEQRDMLISDRNQELSPETEQEAAAAAGQTQLRSDRRTGQLLWKSETDSPTQSPIGSTTAEAVEERVVDIASLNLTDDPLCNSEDLRKLMLDNIDENLNSSKRLIQLAAEAQFGGRFDVICANGDFRWVN
ncbi:ground-like domain protein [Cooperia oncophora]